MMLYIVGFGLVGLLLIAGVFALVFRQEIARYQYQTSLFTGADQQQHFIQQERYFPSRPMTAAKKKYTFPKGETLALPASFSHADEVFETDSFLTSTDTSALIVLKNGSVMFEDYWLTGSVEEPWLTHSLSKSFISAAVGLAVRDGLISSVDDAISDYVPALSGSGYDSVAIRDVLQMSSGIKWDETYSDPDSDINRLGRVMFWGSSFDDFVSSMVNERVPGTYNRYTGMDTQALTMLVASVSGQSVAEFLQNELWHPLGAEHEAFWTTDKKGRELGLGGLNATARDLAKFGELYRLGGTWQGQQILPADWVKASVSADRDHLRPGESDLSAHTMGYGYQWWIPKADSGAFLGIGIYNQFIYVSPESGVVIVKLSCNRYYASEDSPRAYREMETISLFEAISEKLGETVSEL
ncbi:MAG: serine hydrolase [Pseudomonadota bacterium]